MTAFLPPTAAASAVHRDDADRERAVHRGDQGLEHPLGRDAERLARLEAVGPGARVVRVLVQGKSDLRALEGDRRRGTSSSHPGNVSLHGR
jgi:hypothetical protein